jgi:hypothetical protein
MQTTEERPCGTAARPSYGRARAALAEEGLGLVDEEEQAAPVRGHIGIPHPHCLIRSGFLSL